MGITQMSMCASAPIRDFAYNIVYMHEGGSHELEMCRSVRHTCPLYVHKAKPIAFGGRQTHRLYCRSNFVEKKTLQLGTMPNAERNELPVPKAL